MNKACVTIRFEPDRLLAELRKRWKQGLPELSGMVLEDCNRYARDDTGALIQSAYAASKIAQGRLIWNTAYARRVYYTGVPSCLHNPSASLRWCEKAKSAHAKRWRDLAAKRLGGSTV